jgi:cellulose synthase/poly-beta-1,6-N-acetylglucosamine synthase-like glycosyltransferase
VSPAPHAEGPGLVLGVIVPCRNEAAVIERKLRNLVAGRWPFSQKPHQVVVVDDGSTDGTAERARELCAQLFARPSATNRMSVPMITDKVPAAARVIVNGGQAGKAGAIRAGIQELTGLGVDVLVLTDADVILRPPSLLQLEHAFRTRPELGMACGRQEFVRDLLDDGSCRGRDGKEPVAAAEPYDRWTAQVRRRESRKGRLFSVHGQLLAWRASLGIAPTPGIAADDLDLMFQVRAQGRRIELLEGPTFLETKPASPQARREQQVRRAQAYVQVMAGRSAPAGAGLGERLQLLGYRRLPLLLPWLLVPGLVALVALTAVVWMLPGDPSPLVTALRWLLPALLVALLVQLASPTGRHVRELLGVIRQAQAAERSAPIADRWERASR